MEQNKTFLVTFHFTKLKRFICNYQFKKERKNIASDNEEVPKDSESSSDKKKEAK